jgi:phosphatidylserine/phosphatidylglycerophosphate/cardiolipin synthase-like enzyme
MLEALRSARHITFSAWFLRDGPVLRELEDAAGRGADVRVRLDGFLWGAKPELAAGNRRAVKALRAAGADASIVHKTASDGPDLHLKAAVCDGRAYLDDCNWNMSGDTVVRDTTPSHVRALEQAASWHDTARTGPLSLTKGDALDAEHRTLAYVPHCGEAVVETEDLHRSAVTSALRNLAAHHVRCRVLVSANALKRDPKTRQTALSLQKAGVDVRSTQSSEKLAVLGTKRAWIGSAQATSTYLDADEIDWSLTRTNANFVRTLHARFDSHWRASMPVT